MDLWTPRARSRTLAHRHLETDHHKRLSHQFLQLQEAPGITGPYEGGHPCRRNVVRPQPGHRHDCGFRAICWVGQGLCAVE